MALKEGIAAVEVKKCVEDYTWAELSAIADEIADSGSPDKALGLAVNYNLCNADGTLDGTQTKTVTLSDGTETSVMIIGFDHDEKANGSGKAGITFQFTGAIAESLLCSENSNEGGWNNSLLKSVLQEEIFYSLPSDLKEHIVSVAKYTNNVGNTNDPSSVSTTAEALWLPSIHELVGDIDWWSDSYDVSKVFDVVTNAEGEQYQVFKEIGVNADNDTNDSLVRLADYGDSSNGWWSKGEGTLWWTRTPAPFSDSFYCFVTNTGNPRRADGPAGSAGVVPCFCIGDGGIDAEGFVSVAVDIDVSDILAEEALASAETASNIEDYSWGELKRMAEEISASGSEEAAIQTAIKYGLCKEDGTLDGSQTKKVTLNTGVESRVEIVGFYHDDKADGSGKSGITFRFIDAITEEKLVDDKTNAGGWEQTIARDCLNGRVLESIPDEISDVLTPVRKMSNNVGFTDELSSVTATVDSLWLFSSQEMVGDIHWYSEAEGVSEAYDAVTNAEGHQYQLFRDLKVNPNSSNKCLISKAVYGPHKHGMWKEGAPTMYWSRSATPFNDGFWNFVVFDGLAERYEFGAIEAAIVPGFCL